MFQTSAPAPDPSGPRRSPTAVTGFLLAGLSFVLFLATGCTAPTPTFSAYRHAADQSITELISAAETGAMLGDVRLADGATSPYLGTTVESAEETARSISKTFGTRQPPTSEADALREDLVPLGDRVVNTLAELRIALEWDDLDTVEAARETLRGTSEELTDLQEGLS